MLLMLFNLHILESASKVTIVQKDHHSKFLVLQVINAMF